MRSGSRGFTLVELMTVVIVVGVLAVLGIYGVRKYVASSKAAEARNSVAAIAKAAAAAYDKEASTQGPTFAGQTSTVMKHLCASATASVPASLSSVQGKKYQSSPTEWQADSASNGGFACLGFAIDQPQYYMYSYAVSGTGNAVGDTFTAMAQGDLGGAGSTSQFKLAGVIASSFVLNVAPTIDVECVRTGGADCPDQ